MSYCTKCGNKLQSDDKFCAKCGNEVNGQFQAGQENFKAIVNENERNSGQCEEEGKKDDKWWIEVNNQADGPFSQIEIMNLYSCKEIADNTRVRNDKGNWVPLHESGIQYADLLIGNGNSTIKKTSSSEVKDTYIFMCALAPIFGAIIELFIPVLSNNFWAGLILYQVLYGIFGALDDNELKKAGLTPPSLGWIFFVPVYLYERSKRASKSQSPLITWIIALIISFGIPSIF